MVRNNYGQRWQSAGALCCFTAIAPLAAGGSAGTVRVARGNAKIAAGLVSRSRAELRLATRVVAISLAEGGRESGRGGEKAGAAEEEARGGDSLAGKSYVVTAETPEGGLRHETFDHVVLALPQPAATIDLRGLGRTASSLGKDAAGEGGNCRDSEYQHVHTTLVWGWLDPAYFNISRTSKASYKAAVKSLNQRSDVLVGDGARVPFNSIGRIDVRPSADRVPGRNDPDAVDINDGVNRATACPADSVPPAISAQHGLDLLPRPRWKLFSEKVGDRLSQVPSA